MNTKARTDIIKATPAKTKAMSSIRYIAGFLLGVIARPRFTAGATGLEVVLVFLRSRLIFAPLAPIRRNEGFIDCKKELSFWF
jgi:hypothetical protein